MVISPSQFNMAVTTMSQKTNAIPKMEGDLQSKLQYAVQQDEWLQENKTLVEKQGLWWKGERLYVPKELRKKILERYHDAKSAGYFGFIKTLHLIR